MKTYDKFLDYYDQIVRWINSPIDEETDFLENEVIKTHNPEAKDILEVACWTGIVAKELIKLGYNYTWLDINEKMLEKAKQNLKNLEKRLILWDMTNFNLNQKFDIVLCNYNSICHLLDWKSWQDFFEMAEKHLKKWWILVFDINTIFEFSCFYFFISNCSYEIKASFCVKNNIFTSNSLKSKLFTKFFWIFTRFTFFVFNKLKINIFFIQNS